MHFNCEANRHICCVWTVTSATFISLWDLWFISFAYKIATISEAVSCSRCKCWLTHTSVTSSIYSESTFMDSLWRKQKLKAATSRIHLFPTSKTLQSAWQSMQVGQSGPQPHLQPCSQNPLQVLLHNVQCHVGRGFGWRLCVTSYMCEILYHSMVMFMDTIYV